MGVLHNRTATAGAGDAEAPGRSRREEVALAVFGTWMITGLFLDGWAHQADKPETFFSPWHGVLYSGFVAALLWFAWDGWRATRTLLPGVRSPGSTNTSTDRLASLGLVLFVVGAVGDGVWHEIFGVEVDLEALLSPTHLLLLIGGFLMVTAPLRAAVADPDEPGAPTFRQFLPQVVTLTLATALVSFFTMYLSAFWGIARYQVEGDAVIREALEARGVGAILVTNLLLIAPVLFVLRRWTPPAGTFTFLFSFVAVAMTGLDGFEVIELALPAVVAGMVADVLARRRAEARVVCAAVPLVMWTLYFVVSELSYGVEWPAELVGGSVVLAGASSLLLAALTLRGPTAPSNVGVTPM